MNPRRGHPPALARSRDRVPGQGPQWAGMGRDLYDALPAFRAALDRCDAEFRRHTSWSVVEELRRPETESRLHRTSVAQPAIFAIQYALTEVFRQWGIVPDAVVGHSAGEAAAAWAAGSCRSRMRRGSSSAAAS